MKWSVKASSPVAVAAALLLWPAAGHARGTRPAPAACLDASRTALQQEREERLAEARAQLAACAHWSCGRVVSRQCKLRLKELDKVTPSIIPLATDEAGAPLAGLRLSLDGKPLAAPVGKPWWLDPGPHEITFEAEGRAPFSQKLVVLRGQRRRIVSAILRAQTAVASPKTSEPPADVFETPLPASRAAPQPSAAALEAVVSEDPPRPLPPPHRSAGPYLLGAVGLVGLGGYALLTHWGRTDNDALVECKPLCPPQTLRHIRQLYQAADVSAAVGAAALLGSATWFLLRGGTPAEERRSRTVLDVRPTRAGAIATVAGAF
jgi:hypothetical protein